jgi:hypothetical protein
MNVRACGIVMGVAELDKVPSIFQMFLTAFYGFIIMAEVTVFSGKMRIDFFFPGLLFEWYLNVF